MAEILNLLHDSLTWDILDHTHTHMCVQCLQREVWLNQCRLLVVCSNCGNIWNSSMYRKCW